MRQHNDSFFLQFESVVVNGDLVFVELETGVDLGLFGVDLVLVHLCKFEEVGKSADRFQLLQGLLELVREAINSV